jgi:hypothetical protein
MEREEEIRQIAYQLWEEAGCPQGRALEHYFKAEAILNFQQRHGVVASSGIQMPVGARSRA